MRNAYAQHGSTVWAERAGLTALEKGTIHMWIFTETGFVSAVVDYNDAEVLVVRSRDRLSLEPLASATGQTIVIGEGTDYPYRLRCDRESFSGWLVAQVQSMAYGNFKNQVHHTRGHDFAHTLMSVWSSMLDVTDEEALRR